MLPHVGFRYYLLVVGYYIVEKYWVIVKIIYGLFLTTSFTGFVIVLVKY